METIARLIVQRMKFVWLTSWGKGSWRQRVWNLADIFGRLAYGNIFELVFCMIRCSVRSWQAGAKSPGHYSREMWGCRGRLSLWKKVEEKVPEFQAAVLWALMAATFWLITGHQGELERPLGRAGWAWRGSRAPVSLSALLSPPVSFFSKYAMIDGCGLISYCISDDFIPHFLKEVAK